MSTEKDLPHRTWSSLRDLWLEHVPPDLDPSDVDISMLLGMAATKIADKQTLNGAAGLREQTLRDVLFLRQKSLYCISCAESCSDNGFSTWSGPTMYDACFFLAKAFIYFLGVRDIARDARAYLDIFYFEYKKGHRQFDGCQIFLLKERLTHDMVWALFGRQLRTLTIDVGDVQEKVLELRNFDLGQFSRERNRLLYKPFSWSREDELQNSDLGQRCTYLRNSEFFADPNENAEYVDKYFFLAFAISSLLDTMLLDLGDVAPAVLYRLIANPGPRPIRSFLFA